MVLSVGVFMVCVFCVFVRYGVFFRRLSVLCVVCYVWFAYLSAFVCSVFSVCFEV